MLFKLFSIHTKYSYKLVYPLVYLIINLNNNKTWIFLTKKCVGCCIDEWGLNKI